MPEQIITSEIGQKVGTSFLNYANAVIEDRALPNILDGLKPVQRRILYSLHELGLEYNKPHRKVAKVVGHCLGNFHPHSDASVADALTNMGRDFACRYPLIDGHGNFGSVDGDPAAAMRYIECRMSKIAQDMMADIEKDTINMVPNYDDSLKEPAVLSTMFPNLLANGSTGIAVGMGTNIPPHYAGDLYKAMDLIIDNELAGLDTPVDDLIAIVKAPDFPTKGEILGLESIAEGYRTGKGKVTMRGKYEIVGRQIVITEIPYRVNKADLVASIGELKQSLPDIKEVRDESDKEGVRIVVDLAKDANAQWLVKQLLKKTNLQCNFSMNMVALANGKPIQFSLKTALEYFVGHVADVTSRKTRYVLDKLQHREEIVKGFLLAYANIDQVIKIIRASSNAADAQNNLMASLTISQVQAKAITDMRLASLTKLSKISLDEELKTLQAEIADCQWVLADVNNLLSRVKDILQKAATSFTEGRMTTISEADSEMGLEERDMIKEDNLVLTYTNGGLIKLVPESEYQTKGRRTKGIQSMPTKADDAIRFMSTVHSKDDLLLLTNIGQCYTVPIYKIPVSSRAQMGKYLNNYVQFSNPAERIVGLLSRKAKQKGDLLLFTKLGMAKRLSLADLSTRMSYTRVITMKDGDELISASCCSNDTEMILVTAKGKGLKFKSSTIRASGRAAMGVKGMKIAEGDALVDAVNATGIKEMIIVTNKGISKRVLCDEFTVHGRNTGGMKAISNTDKNGDILPEMGQVLGAMAIQDENDDIFIVTQKGQMSRFKANTVRLSGRSAKGVNTINMTADDLVVSIALLSGEGKEDEQPAVN